MPKELQLAVDDVLMQGQGCDNSVKPRPKRVELIANYVDVSGEKFAVIGASLLLIRMIQDYLRCLVKLPETSLLHKLADLLRYFFCATSNKRVFNLKKKSLQLALLSTGAGWRGDDDDWHEVDHDQAFGVDG